MNSLHKMDITGDLAQAKCKSVTIILAVLDVRRHVIKVMWLDYRNVGNQFKDILVVNGDTTYM